MTRSYTLTASSLALYSARRITLLSRLADIRPGEGPAVVRATLVLFALIAGHTLLETTRDTLFLGELPASRLAFAYGALAVLAVVATKLSNALAQRFGRRSALFLTLLFAAYGTVLFYLVPHSKAAVFSLYAFSGMLGSVAVVQFWILASNWFTVAQGKRLLGLVSAGGVLGAVFGASLAVLVLRFVSVDKLLLVAAGCFVVASLALSGTSPQSDEPTPYTQQKRPEQAFRTLRRHPYLLCLAALLAFSTAALLTTDYLFKSVAARSLAPEKLANFFAVYYALLNGAALLVQVFVSGYLVRRLGVVTAFLVLPLLLLGGGVALLVFGGSMLLVLLTKGADGALRHSVHRVTSELLWMPLDERLRGAAKSFIDTVVVRVSQALAATLLLALASQGWDDPRTLALVLVCLLLLWVGFGLGLRRGYLALLRDALTSGRRGVQGFDLDLNAVEVAIEALSSRDASRVIAAIEILSAHNRGRLIPALILYHESIEVLVVALDAIGTKERSDWVPLAKRLLDHESERVRVAAMRALSRAGISEAARGRLNDVSPEVRGHAAFLVAELSATHEAEQHPAIQAVLRITGARGLAARQGLLEAIAASPSQRYAPLLLQLVDEGMPELVPALAVAMKELPDPRFVPFLIEHLKVRGGREAIREALVAHGDLALERLQATLADEAAQPALRRHIPRAVSAFGTQRAADILVLHMTDERHGLVRYKLLMALRRLVHARPVSVERAPLEKELRDNLAEHLRMAHAHSFFVADAAPEDSPAWSLLSELLNDKAEQALERAFTLLSVLHPGEDIKSMTMASRSADKKVRAQALEYLDALSLEARLLGVRQMLNVIADDLPIAEKVRRLRELLPQLPDSAREELASLMREPDATLATIAAYYALQFDRESLAEQIAEVEVKVRSTNAEEDLFSRLIRGRETGFVS